MSKKLFRNEQERIFKRDLESFFSKEGFHYFHEYQNTYFRKITSELLIEIIIFSYSDGKHIISNRLSHLAVENIILEVGLPNIDLSSYKEGKSFLHTLEDSLLQNEITYKTSINPVYTEYDVHLYCIAIINYIEGAGNIFINRYSHLVNVLNEMNNLQKQGEGWHKILSGMAEHLFRGLIIAKLCNDPSFTEKIKYCDEKFYNIPLLINQGWLPFYESLKEKLFNLNPPSSID